MSCISFAVKLSLSLSCWVQLNGSLVPGSEPLLAVGKIMPYSGIEIRDEDNKPLPIFSGEIGEIALMCEGKIEILNIRVNKTAISRWVGTIWRCW